MYKIDLERLIQYRGKDCPCKINNGKDIICPCIDFCKTGDCKCRVFQKINDKIEDIDELVN